MEPNQNPISTGDLLYDPARAAQIADTLRELLDPAYILLFGKMAGRTPLSDVLAYDLLVVTDDEAPYDWVEAKRYLKMKLPWAGHGVPYVNLYIHSRREVDTNRLLFHLARREGIVLHRSHNRKFSRPKMPFDFGQAATAAERYARTFLPSADRLAEFAGQQIDHSRESAFAMAQAAVYYFRTLFYVYHGFEARTCDVRKLHQRLRTLSGLLPLLFETEENRAMQTLHRLNLFSNRAQYDPAFAAQPEELAHHLGRVRRLGRIVRGLCYERIALYDAQAV